MDTTAEVEVELLNHQDTHQVGLVVEEEVERITVIVVQKCMV
tara:strand:- start:152 stop:277 length:126 start_codon:yes stop_codon:yes gene_type:complete